ncbi:MAG: Gfo/Idh/MocA family oxidoreductase [Kutzneria sp.]|nr:Gfo/Idh/MocA family oxidoreductase [Kutzneria sp.]
MSGLRIGVVGLGFGTAFLPLYLSHPDVHGVAICDADPTVLGAVGDQHAIEDRFDTLEAMLADDTIDAVHIATPVRFHVEHSVAVLNAGKHCACAVPMATDFEGLRRIIGAQRSSGRNYMMMETMVFGREFFYVRDLYERGELGPLSFLRGMHIQNLDNFPRYWYGYPPLTYSTHALSPLLALSGARVVRATALGSGRLTPDRMGDFPNTFPTESALFRLDRDDLAAEVTVSFFQFGRAYQEGFHVYGQDAGVEWPQTHEGDDLSVFRLEPVRGGHWGRSARMERVQPPDRADLLPAELAPFTHRHEWTPPGVREPITVHSGHSGSHPHLVHEFVSSIVRHRRPLVDAVTAAAWTAPGIAGHASALHNGDAVEVPDFGA